MSCNNDSFNLMESVQREVREILECLEEDGLLTYAQYKVFIVNEIVIGANRLAGIPGTKKPQKVQIKPSPMVEVNTKFKEEDYVIEKLGTAKVTRIMTDIYSREQLEGADYFEIDGSPYDLIEGSTKRTANGLYWELTLTRRKQNNKTAT